MWQNTLTKQVKTDGCKYKTKNYRAKKRDDIEMLEQGQIIRRYRNKIVLNTKKNVTTKYANFGLGSKIKSIGDYFLAEEHSPLSLHNWHWRWHCNPPKRQEPNHHTTQCPITEDLDLQQTRCQNLKYCNYILCFCHFIRNLNLRQP